MDLTAALHRVVQDHGTLTQAEAHSLLAGLFSGDGAGEAQRELRLAALLGGLGARGETAAEIAGFAAAMRSAATPLPLTPEETATLVDTCGTGGDASGTFNISTAAALVAAAAGARVAKHGNRAVTSRCGSGDVLEALGIPIHLNPDAAAAALHDHGFTFLLASNHHPAMAAVMPVRRGLGGVRTTFNMLGPLANPAGAPVQVMGVYAPHLVPLVAEAMVLLGVRRSMVVHGTDTLSSAEHSTGMDEFSISGPTYVAEVCDGQVIRSIVTPEQFGLSLAPLSALEGGNAEENADILRSVFAGERGPRRDIVALNAAAVLLAADLAPTLNAGLTLAQHTLDSGTVTRLVEALSS